MVRLLDPNKKIPDLTPEAVSARRTVTKDALRRLSLDTQLWAKLALADTLAELATAVDKKFHELQDQGVRATFIFPQFKIRETEDKTGHFLEITTVAVKTMAPIVDDGNVKDDESGEPPEAA